MFTLPFLAQNRAQVTALLQSDLAKTGTVIINLCDAGGWRQFSNSKHPITKPDDLQGLKMRTNGMNTIDKTFIALGATTTTIPYSDLYMGLKTGVADGQENPWVNVEGMKFYEVQDYCVFTNHIYSANPIFMNKDFFDSLTADQQQIVREAADYAVQVSREKRQEQDQDYYKTIEENCTIVQLTEDEQAQFQNAVAGMYDKVVEKTGQEVVDMMYEACGLK